MLFLAFELGILSHSCVQNNSWRENKILHSNLKILEAVKNARTLLVCIIEKNKVQELDKWQKHNLI